MCRESLPLSPLLWTVVLLASAVSCRGPAIDVTALDVFSGCERGAPHVKVLIHLQGKDAEACRPEVTPASVCVAPKGKVHFKVASECDKPATPRVTEPKLKRKLDGSMPGKQDSLPGCALDFDKVGHSQTSARDCTSPTPLPRATISTRSKGTVSRLSTRTSRSVITDSAARRSARRLVRRVAALAAAEEARARDRLLPEALRDLVPQAVRR
jgi:hypothetical protein